LAFDGHCDALVRLDAAPRELGGDFAGGGFDDFRARRHDFVLSLRLRLWHRVITVKPLPHDENDAP
jgi:hypothetical protein